MEEGGGRRRRRSFTAQYKADVVAMCQKGDRTVAGVAQDLGIPRNTVHRWVTEAEHGGNQEDALSTSEREELVRLRKENRVLREERDILKRATAFFAKETR